MKYLSVLATSLIILCLANSCKKEEATKNIVVLGHAGISISNERAVYPPNTKIGLEYGMDVLGADGVEVDVQMTKDSVLVLFHDEFLEQNTNGNGCVSQYVWEDVKEMKYSPQHKIESLREGMKSVLERDKTVMLDIKHYDFCEEGYIDFEMFNRALNDVLVGVSDFQKKKIIVNSRYINVLNTISDTLLIKSFETDDIADGIESVNAGLADMLTLKLAKISETTANNLRANNITYCIFGVKVKAEINQAIKYQPDFIISDNVSRTQRILN